MTNIRGSKFEPFTAYLLNSGIDELTLSFNQIETILGFSLYPSARKHTAYWHPSKTHMLPKSWIEAGYEMTHLDIQSEIVTLRKIH